MTSADLVFLAIVCFTASVVSVVTGATSLITVPALLVFGIEPRTAIGTNMLEISGLSVGATIPFLQKGGIDQERWPALLLLTIVSSGRREAPNVSAISTAVRPCLASTMACNRIRIRASCCARANLRNSSNP